MSRAEVLARDTIYLASRDPLTGAVLREGRFALAPGTAVTPILQGLNPAVIAIGEQGRDTQPFASTISFSDCSGGILALRHRPRRQVARCWWTTCDVRYPEQITLARRKVDTGKPADVTVEQPRRGGEFGNRVWAAWDSKVRQWTEAGGWTTGAAAGNRTLTGSSTPVGDPTAWEGGWFWPLGASGIDVWNGTTWFNIAKPCVGLVVYTNTLWGVGAGGQVFSTNQSAIDSAADIAAATLVAADFADRVRISDNCSGMVLFLTSDGNDLTPYVLGKRTLYQIDAAGATPTYLAIPAGPQLPPHRFPMRASPLAADAALYIAQGNGVVQWTGDTARAVGLDDEDGLPIEFRGAIVQLLNGGQDLFALIDATAAPGLTPLDIYGTGPVEDGVLAVPVGRSWLASRSGEGWVPRAVSDGIGSAATCLWMSAAEQRYDLWFSWDGRAYRMALEQGLYNPLDDPTGEFEPAGEHLYSIVDFEYLVEEKIGLLIEIETGDCTATHVVYPSVQFDQGGPWWSLYNQDGSGWGIATDGLHRFLLAANPAPVTTAPLVFADEPVVGKAHRRAQGKLVLVRGSSVVASPRVLAWTMHAIKSVQALTGWSMTLDLGSAANGRSPWRQRALLADLINDNERGLLHFSYLPDPEGDTGEADVRSVKVTGHSGLESTGLARDYAGRVRLQLSETRHSS